MSSCVICGSDELRPLAGFERFQRVTSDCKPWRPAGGLLCCTGCGGVQKAVDDRWLSDIAEIYGAYDLFALSSGSEQVIFTGRGEPRPRSAMLVEMLTQKHRLPEAGRLLDIGCGTGAALRRFSQALPAWRLNGHELSDRSRAELRKLPNFDELYVGDLSDIPGKFDVITMIHTLEHIIDPMTAVREAAELLTPDGILLIEVPDLETSPYDVLIADHRTHFTKETLGYLAARAGVAASLLSNEILPKELTLIGTREVAEARAPEPRRGLDLALATLGWLTAVQGAARDLSATGGIGIFGTSISGTWCFSEIESGVAFFVDEDASRVGRSYHGRPIHSPQTAPADSTVYVPLAPVIADKVAARLSGTGARYVPPPAFPASPAAGASTEAAIS